MADTDRYNRILEMDSVAQLTSGQYPTYLEFLAATRENRLIWGDTNKKTQTVVIYSGKDTPPYVFKGDK